MNDVDCCQTCAIKYKIGSHYWCPVKKKILDSWDLMIYSCGDWKDEDE